MILTIKPVDYIGKKGEGMDFNEVYQHFYKQSSANLTSERYDTTKLEAVLNALVTETIKIEVDF